MSVSTKHVSVKTRSHKGSPPPNTEGGGGVMLCFRKAKRGLGGTLDPHCPKGHPHPQTKKVIPLHMNGWFGVAPGSGRKTPRESQILGLVFEGDLLILLGVEGSLTFLWKGK